MRKKSSPSSRVQGPPEVISPMRESTVVVLEFSAAWPHWLKPKHSADATVIAQDHGDNPIVVIGEVAKRAAQLEAVSCHLGTVVLVSNGATDVSEAASRHSLVRALLTRLGELRLGAPGGRKLVLTVDGAAGVRARRDLDLLARSFERHARRNGVELAVHEGDARPAREVLERLVPLSRAG